MLNKIDDFCAERDKLKSEQPNRMPGKTRSSQVGDRSRP
jgi:hypothetical protein